MFVDVDTVRQVQLELDKVIEEGVNNIVDLLKKADSKHGSSPSGFIDEDTIESKRRKLNAVKGSWTHDDANIAREEPKKKPAVEDKDAFAEIDLNQKKKLKPGKLTDQLLQQGIVTQKMINQLKRELANEDEK